MKIRWKIAMIVFVIVLGCLIGDFIYYNFCIRTYFVTYHFVDKEGNIGIGNTHSTITGKFLNVLSSKTILDIKDSIKKDYDLDNIVILNIERLNRLKKSER